MGQKRIISKTLQILQKSRFLKCNKTNKKGTFFKINKMNNIRGFLPGNEKGIVEPTNNIF